MKRLDQVKIHYDWALTHNMNWGLIVTDHYSLYTGPLVRFKYEGAMLDMICHPDQRFAAPTANGGYRWIPIKNLDRGDRLWFVKADIKSSEWRTPVSITEYEMIIVQNELLYTLSVDHELSFICHDLICHRNPAGYKADTDKLTRQVAEMAGSKSVEIKPRLF